MKCITYNLHSIPLQVIGTYDLQLVFTWLVGYRLRITVLQYNIKKKKSILLASHKNLHQIIFSSI